MLNYTQAQQAEGQPFKLSAGAGPVLDLTLIAVEARETRGLPTQFRDPFVLFLKGTKDIYCPQAIYRFENVTLGTFEAFIVPIAHDPQTGEFTYQAVFN